ncbi:MAG: VOC family protein [Nocardioidaceae bacterium]
MATKVQVAIDCHDSALMVQFWATALHYAIPDPPEGFDRWSDYWRSFDLPEDEIDDSPSSVVDPDGFGPRICFLPVPERKTVKNRVHLDLTVSGGREATYDANASMLRPTGSSRPAPPGCGPSTRAVATTRCRCSTLRETSSTSTDGTSHLHRPRPQKAGRLVSS